MTARRFLTPWCTLIAMVAICATTTAAKADLTLTIDEYNKAGTAVVDTKTVTVAGNSLPSGTATFSGYTINYSATTPSGTGSQSLALDSTITAASSALASRKFVLTLETSSGTATKGFFDGLGAVGGGLELNTALTYPTGANVGGSSRFTGFDASGNVKNDEFDDGVAPPGTVGAPTQFTNNSSRFDLSTITSVTVAAGQSVHTTTTATVALPEPSGIFAAMAGLPCLGMLIGFARRRRAAVEATPAV